MARTYTWAQIRTKIRQRTNKEKSQFVTDSEIDGLMEESLANLHSFMVLQNENYKISSTTINTIAGTSDYALPADFFKLRGVDVVDSTVGSYPLKQLNWEDRHIANNTALTASNLIGYVFYNNNLRLLPTPQDVKTLTVYYLPAAPVYVSDATTIDGVNGWETYVIYDVASTIVMKEERDPSAMLAKKAQALINIKQQISNRDYENPITVSDTKYYDV